MKESFEKIVKALATLERENSSSKALLDIKAGLTDLLLLLQIKTLLGSVESAISENKGSTAKPAAPKQEKNQLDKALENLESIVATKKDQNGKRTFLLHRLTADFEYEKAQDGNQYSTDKTTEWAAEEGVTQLAQDRSETTLKGANPTVSCFIPEEAIVKIDGAQGNTGEWGELGQNPHKNKYVIFVKPGKYEMHSELKGA